MTVSSRWFTAAKTAPPSHSTPWPLVKVTLNGRPQDAVHLGLVSQSFSDIYPRPDGPPVPSFDQLQLAREIMRHLGFVAPAQQDRLRHARAFNCGNGGMGGAFVLALARAGIGGQTRAQGSNIRAIA